MRRTVRLAAFVGVLLLVAAEARAQLVPISQCGSAIPCNIPIGYRPADAAALSPQGRVGNGNALVGVEMIPAEGFKPELVTRSIAEDPSERAARIFIKRNPGFAMPRTERPAEKRLEPAAAKSDQPQTPAPAPPAVPVLPDR